MPDSRKNTARPLAVSCRRWDRPSTMFTYARSGVMTKFRNSRRSCAWATPASQLGLQSGSGLGLGCAWAPPASRGGPPAGPFQLPPAHPVGFGLVWFSRIWVSTPAVQPQYRPYPKSWIYRIVPTAMTCTMRVHSCTAGALVICYPKSWIIPSPAGTCLIQLGV